MLLSTVCRCCCSRRWPGLRSGRCCCPALNAATKALTLSMASLLVVASRVTRAAHRPGRQRLLPLGLPHTRRRRDADTDIDTDDR